MKELGLFGAVIPAEYGGLGPAAVDLREDHRADLDGVDVGVRHHQLAPDHGVHRQRDGHARRRSRAFLPQFATGEVRGGLALTEPDAGTDLQAIRTTARRVGDEYIVNGTKTWISNGIAGSCFALLVKTDPHADPRHKGMSMLLAREGAGLPRRPQAAKSSATRGSTARELVFEDYRVPADRLIGERRRARHGVQPSAAWSSAGSMSRRAASASRRRRWTKRCATASNARPSASRSASIRRSRSSSARWRHGSPRRGC